MSQIRKPDTIIFLHIPKTAGTTLNGILQRQYEPSQIYHLGARTQDSIRNYQGLTVEEKEVFHLIFGHTGFGFHNYVPGPTTYFTFLREPIERVVSFYHYVKTRETHYLNNAAVNEFDDIGAFVSSGITKMVDNGQTRMISGTWLEPGYGAINSKIFEQAKANLHQYFSVVGLTEQFDATLLLLQEIYNWQNIKYVRENVTTVSKRDRMLTTEEEELLQSYNQWDIALYDHATQLFQQQIATIGPKFSQRLRKFERQNKRYRKLNVPLMRAHQRMKQFSIRAAIRNALSR